MRHPLVGRFALYKGRDAHVVDVRGEEVVLKVSGGHAVQDIVAKVPLHSPDWRLRYPEDSARKSPAGPTGTVWVARKPGEERQYASATGFSPQHAAVLLADGYEIFRVDYPLPERFCRAGYAAKGTVR